MRLEVSPSISGSKMNYKGLRSLVSVSKILFRQKHGKHRAARSLERIHEPMRPAAVCAKEPLA